MYDVNYAAARFLPQMPSDVSGIYGAKISGSNIYRAGWRGRAQRENLMCAAKSLGRIVTDDLWTFEDRAVVFYGDMCRPDEAVSSKQSSPILPEHFQ